MQAVSVTEFTTYLARYMEIVRLGGDVVVLDDDEKPIARLMPPRTDQDPSAAPLSSGRKESAPDGGRRVAKAAPTSSTGDADLDRLIALGVVRPGRHDAPTIRERPPLELPVGLLDALLEDREDRF